MKKNTTNGQKPDVYLSLDHVTAVIAHVQHEAEDVHLVIVSHVLQKMVHRDERPCPPHARTVHKIKC